MDSKKNIVIIIVDAFRPKNLSLFGYAKETDINLKEIAKESILFKQHFSSSNSTAPSLTSLFTAKYPNNHGVIHQFPYTKPEEIQKLQKTKFWFPSFLQNKGYNTIGIDWIGLWFKKGFNFYDEKKEKKSNKITSNPYIKKILLNLPNWLYKIGKKTLKPKGSSSFQHADKTIDLAISKIKESNKPFFLFVHFWDTHFPFPTIKNPKKSSKKDIKQVINSIKDKSQREYLKKRITDISLQSTKDIEAKYDLAIKDIDNAIGKLYQHLKKENLWDDTIFVVLGDHGDNLTEHGIYYSHSGLYDESIHVPMIMHLPGIEHKKVDELVQNIDIIPTILEYLNEEQQEYDGKSMLNLIKTDQPIREEIKAFDGLSEDISATRTKTRKVIKANNPKCHLCKASHHQNREEYDLEKDPSEQINLSPS